MGLSRWPRRRRVRICAGVVGAVAVGLLGLVMAAGAGAKKPTLPKIYYYKVLYTGSGSYSHEYTSPDGSESITASFHWHVLFPSVIIAGFPGSSEAGGGEAPELTGFDGSWKATVTGSNGENCTGSGTLSSGGTIHAIAQVTKNPLVKGGYIVSVRPMGGYPAEVPKGADDCSDINGDETSDFWQDWPYNDGVASSDDQPFLAAAHLKPSTEGKVIVPVKVESSELPKSDCGTTPSLGITCTVKYDWTGQVEMTRTGKGKVS